jgi:hypothetical protein
VLTVGLVVGLVGVASAQPVTLRYKWTKGDDIRYRVTQQTTATVSGLPGGMGSMNVETTITQIIRGIVEDVAADGTATIKQVYESFKMEMNSPMANMAIDSANKDAAGPGGNPMNNMLSAIVGESFVTVIGPTGVVQKVEGIDRLMEKMLKNIPQTPASAAALNSMKSGFSDEAMKQMFGQGFSQFPDRPLKVGDTWSRDSTLANPMLGQQTTSTTATLTGVDGQLAKIALKLNVKFDRRVPQPIRWG